MAPRKDFIVWIDLETTGNAPNDEIIEVGSVITDTFSFDVLAQFQATVQCSDAGIERIKSVPAVYDMHKKNGLLTELERQEGIDVRTVDGMMSSWMTSQLGKGTNHTPLGGSGVLHFDRQYIRRDLPRVDARLTYWAYDVGVLRRSFELFGIDTQSVIDQAATTLGQPKTHRALDDIIQHAAEFRLYAEWLRLFG